MKNPLKSFTWSQYKRAMEGLLIMCLGFMLMTGGQFAVQVADNDPRWIPIPKLNEAWIAWLVVWAGFDSIFQNKISNFIFTKIIFPILGPILKPMWEPFSQHPTIQRIVNKFKKYGEKEKENGKQTL